MKNKRNIRKCMALFLSVTMLMQNASVNIQAAAKPTLNKTRLVLQEGGKAKLSVKGKNIKKCSYLSQNKRIAVVSKKGIVRAKKKGTTKILVTVTYKKTKENSKKKLWCKVIVKAKQEKISSNTMKPASSVVALQTTKPAQTKTPDLTIKPVPTATSVKTPEATAKPMQTTPVKTPEATAEPVQTTPVKTPEATAEPVQTTPVKTPETTAEPVQTTPVKTPEATAEPVQTTPVKTPESTAEPIQTVTPEPTQEATPVPYRSLEEGGVIAAAGNIQWQRDQTTSEMFKYSLDETEHYARITGLSSDGKSAEELTIPAEIDGIAVYAVKNSAIRGSQNLQKLVIDEGVQEMDVAAVSNCKNLQNVSIPSTLKLVTENTENPAERSNGIFNKDIALQKIDVASKNPWYQADENALYSKDGRNLIYWFPGKTETEIHISEDVLCIEPQAFQGNAVVETITVSNKLCEIGRDAFRNCTALTELTLPKTLTYCGDSVFAGCESLIQLRIPEGIEDLANRIEGCASLKKVYFPDSLKELSGGIQECGELDEIVISEDNPYLEADSQGCYSKGKEKLFYAFHVTEMEEYIAPESLREIGYNVFAYGYALKTVDLNNVEKIGDCAFSGCSELQNVNFGNRMKNIGESAFSNCTGLVAITLPDGMESIGVNAFYGCTALNKIEFQGTVQKIESNAFGYCSSLESFDVPEGIEYMDSILDDCDMLTKITLSSTVRGFCYGEELDTEPFYNVNALQQIQVDPKNPYMKAVGAALYTADGKTLLYYCVAAQQESYNVEPGTEVIGEGAFKGPMFRNEAPALKSVTLPESVIKICAGAFENAGLQQLSIPDSVQVVGDRAFSGCFDLETVEISKNSSLQEIGMAAFQNCRALEKIYIPATVDKIEDVAFNLCISLSEITYGGTGEQWNVLVPSYSGLGGNIQVASIICSDGTLTPEDMGE